MYLAIITIWLCIIGWFSKLTQLSHVGCVIEGNSLLGKTVISVIRGKFRYGKELITIYSNNIYKTPDQERFSRTSKKEKPYLNK